MHRKTAALLAGALLAAGLVGTVQPATAAATPPKPTAKDTRPVGKVAPKGHPGQAVGKATAKAATALSSVNYLYARTSQNPAVTQGAYATVAVETPYLNPADYHSLAEIALQTTSGNYIEAGWTVDPGINGGSSAPHLFVFWWKNGVSQCYNGCGWVDYAPNTVNAGSSLAAWSGTAKQMGWQYFNPSGVAGAGQWWLSANGSWVGYYPESQWPGGFAQSDFVQMFGEVAASTTTPCTDMGSGVQGSLGNTVTPLPARFASVAYLNGPAVSMLGSTQPAGLTTYTVNQLTARTAYYGGPGWNAAGTGVGTKGSC